MSFVAACVQNRAGPDLHESLEDAVALVWDAAGAGASLVCTAELFTCLDMREGALEVGVHLESGHPALPRFRGLARELELWILLGSLAIRDSGGMARNRSYLLTPDGGIAARHDTIHMFDVDLDGGEDRGFVTDRLHRPRGGRRGPAHDPGPCPRPAVHRPRHGTRGGVLTRGCPGVASTTRRAGNPDSRRASAGSRG